MAETKPIDTSFQFTLNSPGQRYSDIDLAHRAINNHSPKPPASVGIVPGENYKPQWLYDAWVHTDRQYRNDNLVSYAKELDGITSLDVLAKYESRFKPDRKSSKSEFEGYTSSPHMEKVFKQRIDEKREEIFKSYIPVLEENTGEAKISALYAAKTVFEKGYKSQYATELAVAAIDNMRQGNMEAFDHMFMTVENAVRDPEKLETPAMKYFIINLPEMATNNAIKMNYRARIMRVISHHLELPRLQSSIYLFAKAFEPPPVNPTHDQELFREIVRKTALEAVNNSIYFTHTDPARMGLARIILKHFRAGEEDVVRQLLHHAESIMKMSPDNPAIIDFKESLPMIPLNEGLATEFRVDALRALTADPAAITDERVFKILSESLQPTGSETPVKNDFRSESRMIAIAVGKRLMEHFSGFNPIQRAFISRLMERFNAQDKDVEIGLSEFVKRNANSFPKKRPALSMIVQKPS